MYSKSAIDSLVGRVGWRQSTLTDYAILDAGNLASESGYYFNDASGLVTTKNIFECQENPDITSEQFNTFVDSLQVSAITQVLNKVFYDKGENLETITLFPYEHKFDDKLTLGSGFVGMKINVGTNRRTLTTIRNIVLSMDGADTFNIYLYNSNVKDAIQTKSVTVADGDNVVSLDWELPKNTTTYKGGTYYIGYFESDVSVQPYSRNYELGNYFLDSAYNSVEFVRLSHVGTVIDVDGDTITEPMGINLELETRNDYSDLIMSKKNLFDQAVMFQMASIVLGVIYTTTRSNITARLTDGIKSFAFAELNGDVELKTIGMFSKASREIASLRKSLFPKRRISYGQLR